jgi:transcriptional regulator
MDSQLLWGTVEMLILEVVSQGATYGYELAQTVAQRSEGYFDLKEGSLYPALHRLERRGLVSSEWSTEGGRRRRVYGLTATGHTELVSERREWDGFRRGMVGVLGT